MSFPFQSAHAEQALSPVSVCGVDVNRDPAGRFSLNDLHRASGGEKRHQPSDWLRLDQTQALVEELKKPIPGIPGVKEIQPVRSVPGAPSTGGGTFVVRELVYGYAMWISPAFHLTVIRTFDALMTSAAPGFRPPNAQGELFETPFDPAKLAKTFGDCLRLAKQGGLDAEAARQVADRLTRGLLGVSPLAVLNAGTPISAPPVNIPTATPDPGPEVLPMTDLLQQYGDPRSARVVNAAMVHLGLMERRTLELPNHPARVYPVLVADGLLYGANVQANTRHLTTHPMYYPARFKELLARLAEAPVEVPAQADPRAWVGKTIDQMSKSQRAAYKASGLAEERKAQKRLDQRVARQETALEALAKGELWSQVSSRLNLDYYFTQAEREVLRRGERLYEILECDGVSGEIPESLKLKPGEVTIPFSDWMKTRH